jgi:hypothetical protein
MFSHIKYIKGRRGINQVHLNTSYDLLNDTFLDAELQGIREMDEKKLSAGCSEGRRIRAENRSS